MRIENVFHRVKWVAVGAVATTTLTACIVEPVRYRPLYVEPVSARIVVHGHY